jgi:hypothetical protein
MVKVPRLAVPGVTHTWLTAVESIQIQLTLTVNSPPCFHLSIMFLKYSMLFCTHFPNHGQFKSNVFASHFAWQGCGEV